MGRRDRRQAYAWDGDRRAADPIHPRWYTRAGEADLNEKLLAPPVALRLRTISPEHAPRARPGLRSQVAPLAREEMAATDPRAEPLAHRHPPDDALPETD